MDWWKLWSRTFPASFLCLTSKKIFTRTEVSPNIYILNKIVAKFYWLSSSMSSLAKHVPDRVENHNCYVRVNIFLSLTSFRTVMIVWLLECVLSRYSSSVFLPSIFLVPCEQAISTHVIFHWLKQMKGISFWLMQNWFNSLNTYLAY